MPAYIVNSDPQDERTRQLVNLLAQNRVRTTPVEQLDDTLKLLPKGENSLVIVPDFVGNAVDIIRFSDNTRGRAFVIYISDTISAETYKQLSKSGAGEWIRWSSLHNELEDVIHHHASGRSVVAAGSDRRGRL